MIYLDTNVFIAAVEQQGDPSSAARRLLDSATAGSLTAATSELTLAELLVRPFQAETARVSEMEAIMQLRAGFDGDYVPHLDSESLSLRYAFVMTPSGGFRIAPVDREILIRAAWLRSHHKALKLPDAIHVATAMQLGCSHLLSADRRLRAACGDQIEAVDLELQAIQSLLSRVS